MEKGILRSYLFRLARAIQVVFNDNCWFIIVLFLMNFITMGWSLLNEEKWEVLLCYGFSLFFASFSIAALIQVFRHNIIKTVLKSGLIGVSAAIFVIEFFVMYNYRVLIGAGIINSLIETNYREAREFLAMYVGWPEIIGVAVICLLCGAVKRRYNKMRLSTLTSVNVVATLLLLGLGYFIQLIYVYHDFFIEQYIPAQRAYASAQMAIKNIEAYQNLAEKVNHNIVLVENKSSIKNVVLILGESTNRNHMSLYGYQLPTTPNLQRLNDTGELMTFRDVISPHSTTIAVLSKLFTFCNYESEGDWYEYANLIDIMKQAGYKTFWLSNQESSGIWGNVAQLFAANCDYHQFTQLRESREDYGVIDGRLFPLIDAAREQRGDKNFFVVHLMGAHGAYYNRYPYEFAKFHADDIMMENKADKKAIVAQYDNAVYYNDYVVNEIINKFRDDETLVIYVSDHGEAVYDENGFAGHIEENPNKHMIEIPFLAWGSELFKAEYPHKMEQLGAAVERPYMTDDFIHTMLDLIDVKTPEFDPGRSIVNEEFNSCRIRIFSDQDYDREIKQVK